MDLILTLGKASHVSWVVNGFLTSGLSNEEMTYITDTHGACLLVYERKASLYELSTNVELRIEAVFRLDRFFLLSFLLWIFFKKSL